MSRQPTSARTPDATKNPAPARKARGAPDVAQRGQGVAAVAATTSRLTRTQVARMLGMSHSSVRRLETQQELHPVWDDDRGAWMFTEDDVRAYGAKIRSQRRRDEGGTLAASVFRALEAGSDPVAIVLELELHPDVVETLVTQYARMRGGFIVRASDRAELEALPHFLGDLPMCDARTLVGNMRETVKSAYAAGARATRAAVAPAGETSLTARPGARRSSA